MRVLLTGAGGFIGTRLLPALASGGHMTRALLHTPRSETLANSDAGSADQVELRIGSLPDAALCASLCEGMDAVIHAAGVAHVAADATTLKRNNLEATLQLARAAKAAGVRRFVFLSSSKARYPGHSSYAQVKADAEAALQGLHEDSVFEVVCLRPSLVYGVGMRGNLRGLLRALRRPWLPLFPGGAQPIGLVHVDDVCGALVSSLACPALAPGVWELAGEVRTLNEIVHEVRGYLGLSQPRPLPRSLCRLVATLAPLTGSTVSPATYRALYEEPYQQDVEFSRRTGFVPQHAFFSTLPALLEELRA